MGRGQHEHFERAVTVLRAFCKAYRAAIKAWCHGLREADFPAGTWFMRWHGAVIAPI